MKRQFNQDVKVNGSIEANAIGNNLTLALKNFLLSTVYTVGSVFTSFSNDNPNNIFSDTVWVKLPEGTFLMQGGTNFPIKPINLENIAESDGGCPNAVLLKHNHETYCNIGFPGVGIPGHSASYGVVTRNAQDLDSLTLWGGYTGVVGNTPPDEEEGHDGINKNLPPYKACNIWVRTA